MKRSKIIKRIGLVFLVVFILIIGALAAIPLFFKDEIVAAVKDLVNENLNAKVDFKGVDISLLRSFPDVSLQLKEYEITGMDEFEGVRLIGGKSFGVTLDFWSAWNFGKVPLEIKSVKLDKPEVNVIVLRNGKANYDIAKPSTDTTVVEAVPFEIKLREYGIYEGTLVYDDRQGGNFVKAINLTHTGKGDFTQDVYDLATKTSIDKLTAESGGIAYLKNANLRLDAGINVDMPNMKFTLKDNDLRINTLQVKTDGWLAMPNDNDIDMDFTFSAPKSDFKSLFSLIPNAYIEGYNQVKANGTFKLEGFVKGVFSDKPERYPAFRVALDVNNADVKYPDLPLGITNINTKVLVNSPGADLNQMLVDVSNFSMKVGSNPLEGYFKLRTPLTDPDVDTRINGKLNLEELAKAFPMKDIQTLNGLIDANLTVKTKMSTIDKADYENVNMSGTLGIRGMNYAAQGMPPVTINSLSMDFNPRNVRLPAFDMKLGKSDLSGNGSIDNILAYFSPTKTMKGSFVLRSAYFNADEWMTDEPAQAATQPAATSTAGEEVFNRFDFGLDAEVKQLDYDIYKIKDLVLKGSFSPNLLTITQFAAKIGESDLAASGYVTNVWNYLFNNETLGGKLDFRSSYLDLNQFMTSEETAASTEPILVPANINFVMDAGIDRVTYTNMELKNVSGSLVVANEEVRFQNLKANTLGGSIAINGGYNTQNHEKPRFDFGMDIQSMDFQQAFNTFNTFPAVAPIGKYIQGAFNTKLTMSSDLTKDLMPDLNSLSMDGLLHTINGAVKGFAPLEEIGNKLNVAAFKSLNLKDTKNWFTVKNGAVEVKDFDHKLDDIAMKIGGSHQLTGEMDYHIISKIPRAKIGKNPVGAAANTGLDFLSKEASKVGLNVDAGEFVNVQINIGGTLTQPKIGFKILGTDGTSASLKEQATAKLEQEAQKKLDDVKVQAESKLQEEQKKLEAEAAKVVQQAKEEVSKQAEESLKQVEQKVGEEIKEKLGEDVKKKVEELNPFKKKKKGGG